MSEHARQMLRDHVDGERRGDLEATMAPLSDHPVWLIPNFRLEGTDAVRAMYERALTMMPPELAQEMLRALDDSTVTHWGESHCVIEYSDHYPMHRGWVLIVHFDGDRVSGEHGYQPTPDPSAPRGGHFGADFEDLPGVTRLT